MLVYLILFYLLRLRFLFIIHRFLGLIIILLRINYSHNYIIVKLAFVPFFYFQQFLYSVCKKVRFVSSRKNVGNVIICSENRFSFSFFFFFFILSSSMLSISIFCGVFAHEDRRNRQVYCTQTCQFISRIICFSFSPELYSAFLSSIISICKYPT